MSGVHLHVSSGYSARYGASLPADLVRKAAERGVGTLALADRDTVAGTVRFAHAAVRTGIRPVFGVEVAVAPYTPSGPAPRRRTPVRGGAHVVEARYRVTLLARTRAGWARLCRIVSAAHAAPVDGVPVVGWPVLQEYLAGEELVVLLGPVSEPVRALSAGRPDVAGRLLEPWRVVAGAGLRLEAVWLNRQGTGPGSLRLAARTLQLGEQHTVPVVVSNAVRYASPDQHRLADVLDAARLLRPIGPRDLDGGERWLKGPEAMAGIAGRIAEAAGAGPERAAALLAETAATADSCRLDPADLGMGRPHFPEPQAVGAGTGQGDAMRLLRQRCEAGMTARGLDRDGRASEQLEYELGVIGRLGYEGYFLAVAQVVADVRAMGIRVAARGSGAGSMVNHALFIATANPLEHRLLFERFLSERRTSLPDIDLDVESARRLEVYDRIFERFGSSRVAVTGMPETYRARHALRDTGLALGMPPQQIAGITKSFPHIRARDIRSALAELPELRGLAARAGEFGPLWELAEGLDGLPRGYAMHPCGVILSNTTLLDRVPVQPTPGGYPMLQADKADVELEGYGLLKLDVLGVRMQSAMAHAVSEIRRTTGRQLDLDSPDHVDLNDQKTFELIRAADTLACFQIESSGQLDLLSRLQPRHLQDIIADISLFRPGPVAGGMPARFIAARHGGTPHYPHPDLVPILDDTGGVVIWHEQIIAILARMTGCDRAAGDVARRALAAPDRLPGVEAWFRQAATASGRYTPRVIDEVWAVIKEFGAYGFCRAHAVAFAVPAVQSAWLKAHYPAALYAGALEHDPGLWPARVIAADARRHDVPVLPVDINTSKAQYAVERAGSGWGVRISLSTVHGISEGEVARIAEGQPYTSLQDFYARAHPKLPTVERLISVGALDQVKGEASRRDLLLQAAELHRQARTRPGTGQLTLASAPYAAGASGLREMTARDRLDAELGVLKIDVSRHLLEDHHRLLREIGATDAQHLGAMHPGQRVLVAGVRSSTQTPPIASGKRIIFVTLEDGSGLVDLAFFEDSHERCAHTVFHHGMLLVRGTVEARGPRRTVVGEMAWDLDELATARATHGPQAVLDLLGQAPSPTPAQPGPGRSIPDGTAGSRLHPWSDLQPAGTRSADLTRYGHRSPGSAG
ncbi:DNA polymerase III, alpha subunit [Streptomyces sp. ACT-1]|nr:DNA polymerase III, alpha subunit [Streptomyces sp. ACT-1]